MGILQTTEAVGSTVTLLRADGTSERLTVVDVTGGGSATYSATSQGDLAGAPVTFDLPGVVKVGGGHVVLGAVLSGTTDNGDTLTVQFLRDSTPIGPPFIVATASQNANPWSASPSWVDLLPDAAPHTYHVSVLALVGNVQIPAGQAGLWALVS